MRGHAEDIQTVSSDLARSSLALGKAHRPPVGLTDLPLHMLSLPIVKPPAMPCHLPSIAANIAPLRPLDHLQQLRRPFFRREQSSTGIGFWGTDNRAGE